jgi:hypothetical protein
VAISPGPRPTLAITLQFRLMNVLSNTRGDVLPADYSAVSQMWLLAVNCGWVRYNHLVHSLTDGKLFPDAIINMGLFDQYRPSVELRCPVCGESNLVWQGKQGPCFLLVWGQGHAAAVGQLRHDEGAAPLAAWSNERLPNRFEIYASCKCPTLLEAVGITENGVWTQTELISPNNAVANPYVSDQDFKKRLKAYAKHLGHAD